MNSGPTPSPGSRFVRVDLHVHTHPDGDAEPEPDLASYVERALASGIAMLAITDHNSARFVCDAIKAAAGTGLTIVPGIEISTHDGHLLALFAPDSVETLESFATKENLALTALPTGEKRSGRALLDLTCEISERGGLAIPAHVDAANGICESLQPKELSELLSSTALAGLEFRSREPLETWFTDEDGDAARAAAWKARQAVPELRGRGLARLMSSDAHTAEKVGRDRASRTLTRVKLDDANFTALRNAIKLNPKARCKAEATLPVAYPRLVRATFAGGFLDGVTLDFAENLNCLIGGRGSGKSTALLSIRAALGAVAPDDADGANLDDEQRMPDETRVTFIDGTGSERTAIRRRGAAPGDQDGAPIRLRLADLGQDESGRLASGYNEEPRVLLSFLDEFVDLYEFAETEESLLSALDENAADVRQTHGADREIRKLEEEQARLEANLKAAEAGKVEEMARWARLLGSQRPLLDDLEQRLERSIAPQGEASIDLDAVADSFGVDLDAPPAKDFVDGSDGLRTRLAKFETVRKTIADRAAAETREAAGEVTERANEWRSKQEELQDRFEAKKKELEEQGLKVEAGAVEKMVRRRDEISSQLTPLRARSARHSETLKARKKLLAQLRENREKQLLAREATLQRIANQANTHSDGLTIRVYFEENRIDDEWVRWLSSHFGLRTPRVQRLARKISPADLAARLVEDSASLLALTDDDGSPFLDEIGQHLGDDWSAIFELETMRCDDLPRIEVQRDGSPERKAFDHLSAGQQRSVLLSLLLCAERSQPLVLDQPEDHLDGRYIANSVVSHLEAAKERRQIIIATHSANLVVLGDAELVLPMHVEDGHGRPYASGAVDRPETRDEVCALLEGGADAYVKRGERYGFSVDVPRPQPASD